MSTTTTLPYSLFDADNYEDGMSDLIDLVGVDRVLFASDFPHPEGLAQPTHFADALGHLQLEDQAKIMGGNLSRLVTV